MRFVRIIPAMLVAIATTGCGGSPPRPSTSDLSYVGTISDLQDACRRLVLQKYMIVEQHSGSGRNFVHLGKTTQEAEYSIRILEGLAEKKLGSIYFQIEPNDRVVASHDSQEIMWKTIQSDVCRLIGDQQAFLRALDSIDSKNNSSSLIGTAITIDNWTIRICRDLGYYEMLVGTKEHKIGTVMITVTKLRNDNDALPTDSAR